MYKSHDTRAGGLFPKCDLSGTPAAIYLIAGGAAIIVVTSLYVRSIALAQRAAQRQLDIQAWHLEQLLPARAV